MNALPPAPRTFHVFDDMSAFGKTHRIGRVLRHGCRQQQIDRNAESKRDFLVERDRAPALSCLELRQIALRDADGRNQFGLRHLAPFTQDPNRILTARKAINNDLRQRDFRARGKRAARAAHDPGRTDILISGKRPEALVFALWEDSQLLASRCLDELNFCHACLSVVDLAAVADGSNDELAALNIENDTPIADPQSSTGSALEALHVPLAGPCEDRDFGIKPPPHVWREPEPLTRRSRSEDDLHLSNIAYCDIFVKDFITKRNRKRRR